LPRSGQPGAAGLRRHRLGDSRHFAPVPTTTTSLTSAGVGLVLIYRTIDLKGRLAYPLDSTPVSDTATMAAVYASLSAGF